MDLFLPKAVVSFEARCSPSRACVITLPNKIKLPNKTGSSPVSALSLSSKPVEGNFAETSVAIAALSRNKHREATMHFPSLTIGLLSAAIAASGAMAADSQHDDRSYLPPQSLRAKPLPAKREAKRESEPRHSRRAAGAEESSHGIAERRIAADEPRRERPRIGHRRRERYAYREPRFYRMPFFFGMF